jgi:hypothetical protein
MGNFSRSGKASGSPSSSVAPSVIVTDLFTRRLDDLGKSTLRHAAAIDAVIRGQIDPASAATLADAGGGRAVLASVRGLLVDLLATSGKRS